MESKIMNAITGEEIFLEQLKESTISIGEYSYNRTHYRFNPPVVIEIGTEGDWHHLYNEDFDLDESGKDLQESIEYMMADIIERLENIAVSDKSSLHGSSVFDIDN